MPVPGRLPRIVPDNLAQPFTVDGKIIPPGVRIYQVDFHQCSTPIDKLTCPGRHFNVRLHDALQRRALGF